MSDIVEEAISKEAPVMKAWEQYKATDDYKITRKWAAYEDHVDGSLWAAFYEGFCAASYSASGPAVEAADTITSLRAEVERLKTSGIVEVAVHNPSVMEYMKHWEGRALKAEAEVERLRAALAKAKRGLEAGINQYASKDIHGNVVSGDEQYPWVKAMQIGLDATRAALSTQEPT